MLREPPSRVWGPPQDSWPRLMTTEGLERSGSNASRAQARIHGRLPRSISLPPRSQYMVSSPSPLSSTRAAARPISVLVTVTLVTGLSSCGTTEGPTEPEAVVASVAITNGDQSLSSLGGTVQLSAVVSDAEGNEIASA